jgi:hypothetical protein
VSAGVTALAFTDLIFCREKVYGKKHKKIEIKIESRISWSLENA